MATSTGSNLSPGLNIKNKISPSTAATPAEGSFPGVYHLATLPQYYEPQRSNTFKFMVTDLKGCLASWGVTTEQDESLAFELSVKASSVPHFDIEKIEVSRGNSKMYFAGKPTFKEGALTVRDYMGAHTKEILLAWQRQAYNVETEKVGLAQDYKKNATLYELSPDYQIVREWTLEGCWVSSISEGNFDHDTADARTMEATIVYDRAYLVK